MLSILRRDYYNHMKTYPESDSQIHREGLAIVRQINAACQKIEKLSRRRIGLKKQLLDVQDQLCLAIIDVAAICTDDGSNAEVRAFLAAAEVKVPEKYLTEL